MRDADRRLMAVNRRMWDESVPLHVASPSYDVPRFRKGWNPLLPLEVREVGSVRGQTLLHLQCHFGMDTLSWARLGARVTGVDFSPPAIAAARRLALDVGIEAKFVESNLYDAPRRLKGRFDVVYTAKGAICWLPDLAKWATVVAHFMKPGGRFFLMEDHPVSDMYNPIPGTKELVRQHGYFQQTAVGDESPGTYAAPGARLRNALSYMWIHPISQMVNALIGAGLRVESVEEYPFTYWHKFPAMHRGRDAFWHLDADEGSIPLMYTLRARKPAAGR